MDFYYNLCRACEMRNVKVSTAVIEAGEKLGSLNGWKNGATPNSKAVLALALRLNVSSDFLLGLERPALAASAPALDSNAARMLSMFSQLSEEKQEFLLKQAEMYLDAEQLKEKAALV